jgi:hypothetical protein
MKITQSMRQRLTSGLRSLPQTTKMAHFVEKSETIIDDAIRKQSYVLYDKLSDELGLFNPRHKSMAYALFDISARDILAGKPMRTSIVVSNRTTIFSTSWVYKSHSTYPIGGSN